MRLKDRTILPDESTASVDIVKALFRQSRSNDRSQPGSEPGFPRVRSLLEFLHSFEPIVSFSRVYRKTRGHARK